MASTPSLFRESSCRLECYLSSRTILLPINPGRTAGHLTRVAPDGRSKHFGWPPIQIFSCLESTRILRRPPAAELGRKADHGVSCEILMDVRCSSARPPLRAL